MRDSSFDELARGLASSSISRGRAIRLMGAALLGGTLASMPGPGVVLADDECKRDGKKCRKNKQCCSGNCSGGTCAAACVPTGGTCAADTQCCSGLLCDNGQCATCRSTGGSCTTNGECCSGNCSGGTCRPTGTGPNLVTCGCPDGTSVDACDSFDCSSPQPFFALCSSLCASHGGLPVSFLGCGASAVCQPPV